jgi:hypothetical protein
MKKLNIKEILEDNLRQIEKGWESISFINEGETIEVFRHWLIETDFDFSQSHTID